MALDMQRLRQKLLLEGRSAYLIFGGKNNG